MLRDRKRIVSTLLAALLYGPPLLAGGNPGIGVGVGASIKRMPQRERFALDLKDTGSTFVDCSAGGTFTVCCGVEADVACGDNFAWACYEGDGTAITITNKCGNGVETGPFVDSSGTQLNVLTDITNATAPYIPSATANTLGLDTLWAGAFTVFIGAFLGDDDVSDGVVFSHGLLNADGIFIQQGAGPTTKCSFNVAAATTSVEVSIAMENRWAFISCRYDGVGGASSAEARTNGNESAGAPIDPIAPDRNVYFGRYDSATLASRGKLATFALYASELSDATMSGLEADFFGTTAFPDDLSIDRNSVAWIKGGDGEYHAIGQDGTVVQVDGFDVWGATTNYWTDSLDVSAQTKVGTPTDCGAASPTNCDSDAGPFSKYNNGDEADTLGDDDGAAKEGIQSATAGTATGDYTVSCFLASGTLTDYTLVITTDGTGGGSCTGTDLDGTFARKTCTPTAVGGVPTLVKGQLLVGDAVGDTGTIKVSGCQLEKKSIVQRPCISGSTAEACVIDNLTVATTRWPQAAGHLRFNFTPGVAINATQGFISTLETGTFNNGWYSHVTSAGVLRFVTRTGGVDEITGTAALTWTVDQSYLIDVVWEPTRVIIKRDGVVVKAATATQISGIPAGTASIGLFTSVASPCDGRISNVEVSQ